MKKCKDCNEELVLGHNWTESRKKHWVYVCKTCARSRGKKHYKENKEHYHKYNRDYRAQFTDDVYHVYVIDNYAGQTKNIYSRKIAHRAKGRNTDNFRVLKSVDTLTEALELEQLLHSLGYEGSHPKNR